MHNSGEACLVRNLNSSGVNAALIVAIVAHKIYGVPQTINSANYVYFLAYQELFALRSGVGVDASIPEGTHAKERLIPFKELDRIVTGTHK